LAVIDITLHLTTTVGMRPLTNILYSSAEVYLIEVWGHVPLFLLDPPLGLPWH